MFLGITLLLRLHHATVIPIVKAKYLISDILTGILDHHAPLRKRNDTCTTGFT